MKKIWYILILVVVCTTAFCGCIGEKETQKSQALKLYAGAGLKKPMDIVIEKFEKQTGIKVVPNYGPSGGLYTQIKQGQPCDIYFAADWKYIKMLDIDDRLVESKKFLSDYEVLVISKSGKKKGIRSHEDLLKKNVVVVIADPKAPVGEYAEKALKNLGIWNDLINNGNLKARPPTVNQVAIMVKENEVDAGMIYRSVATMYGLNYVEVFPHNLTGEIVFGIGIIKGENEKLAKQFMEFALENIQEFTKYGWEAYEGS